MNFATARALLIGSGKLVEECAEDYMLRRADALATPTMNRQAAARLIQLAHGVPEEHLAQHVSKHADVERFGRDLGMTEDHHTRTRRAHGRLKGQMTVDEVVPVFLEYLDLRLP